MGDSAAAHEPQMNRTKAQPIIYCAVDTADMDVALDIAAKIVAAGCGIKLGLEFFNAFGPEGIRKIRKAQPDVPVFLDLKYHDIPNTVAGAVRAATGLGVAYINLHASGGATMMQAAKEAAQQEAERLHVKAPKILAVTLLTSLDEETLAEIGYRGNIRERVVQMAKLSRESGMDGVVCSSHEIEAIRQACGPDFVLMVPGIRPAGSDKGDQKRIMTPTEAMQKGATHLVIGRPITKSSDPAAAAKEIIASL